MKRRLPFKSKEVKNADVFEVVKTFRISEDIYSPGEDFKVSSQIGMTERKKRQLYEQNFIKLPKIVTTKA